MDKQKKSKNRFSAFSESLYFGFWSTLACLFGFLVVALLFKTGVVSSKMDYAPLFFAFLFACVDAIILSAWFLRHSKKTSDAEKINAALAKIENGDYVVSLDNLSPEYKPLGENVKRVALILRRTEDEKDEFIGDFSHELKTPIVSIRGFAKLLARGSLSEEEKKEYLEFIVSESDRLVDLTASALLLDRLGGGRIEVEKRKFNLAECLRKSILALQPAWEKKNVEIDARLDERTIKSNDELLTRVFVNIIDNAVKFCKENGKVEVKTIEDKNSITVVIADDGIGMNDETKRRMFDKYYRADKSRTTYGNGLGLSTVKKIAELLDLGISVESKLKEGTRFSIVVPIS